MTDDDFAGEDLADLTDAERLESAVMVAIGELVTVVGLPQRDGTTMPRVHATAEPLVNLDRVPAEAFHAACEAIIHLGIALSHSRHGGDAVPVVSVEAGLAAMTAPTVRWAP
jgi:hypothetical protein